MDLQSARVKADGACLAVDMVAKEVSFQGGGDMFLPGYRNYLLLFEKRQNNPGIYLQKYIK